MSVFAVHRVDGPITAKAAVAGSRFARNPASAMPLDDVQHTMLVGVVEAEDAMEAVDEVASELAHPGRYVAYEVEPFDAFVTVIAE